MKQVVLFLILVFGITWSLGFWMAAQPPPTSLSGFLAAFLPQVWAPTVISLILEGVSLGARGIRAEVAERLDGKPVTRPMVKQHIYRAAKAAGLKQNGIHILRHTFCSHLSMRGAPARAIQELAGHAELLTTQRYMHLSPAALDAAIRLLDSSRVPHSRGDIWETAESKLSNVSD